MRCRLLTILLMAAVAACHGSTNAPDSKTLRVANLGYNDTACGPLTCGGVARFQLVNSAGAGQVGVVLVTIQGPTPGTVGVDVRPDGWGAAPLTVNRAARPYPIVACPQGVATGCATASTN
jgi:hypothetical protein